MFYDSYWTIGLDIANYMLMCKYLTHSTTATTKITMLEDIPLLFVSGPVPLCRAFILGGHPSPKNILSQGFINSRVPYSYKDTKPAAKTH